MAETDLIKDIVENYLTLYENQYDFLKNKYKNDAEALNFLTRFVRTERVSRDGKKYTIYRVNAISEELMNEIITHIEDCQLSQKTLDRIERVEKMLREKNSKNGDS